MKPHIHMLPRLIGQLHIKIRLPQHGQYINMRREAELCHNSGRLAVLLGP